MTAQEKLNYLKNIDTYFNHLPKNHKESIYFEILISDVIGEIFKINSFCVENDDVSLPFRVVWNGSLSSLQAAQHDSPDCIARCHNFNLLIEATLKTGANQWTQEFASSIRHLETFISRNQGCDTKNTYIILVAKEISEDTFISLKTHPRIECKFIPLNLSSFAEILDTSIMAYTLKHLDIRQLFFRIPRIIGMSEDVDDFRNRLLTHIINWKKEILNKEANAIIGIKSYEAMRRINRRFVSESEILQILSQSNDISRYLDTIGQQINAQIIERSLTNQNLIAGITENYDQEGEMAYLAVPYYEYKDRECRIVRTVKRINDETIPQT